VVLLSGEALRLPARSRGREREHFERLVALRALVAKLTQRESEVFALIVQGKLNKQIACELGSIERTVKAHRHSIVQKLRVRSLAELVLIAERLGILAASSTWRRKRSDCAWGKDRRWRRQSLVFRRQTPRDAMRSATGRPVAMLSLLLRVAGSLAHLASVLQEAGKTPIFTPIRESSGECRTNCIMRRDEETP
jgi:DNA-binding CsgD family transcriptional regulator